MTETITIIRSTGEFVLGPPELVTIIRCGPGSGRYPAGSGGQHDTTGAHDGLTKVGDPGHMPTLPHNFTELPRNFLTRRSRR